MLNPEEFSHAPTITISAEGLLQATNFMVDTGAAPNVIKERSLNPDTRICYNDPLYLSGITSGRVETLGSVEIKFMGHPVELHVVPDNFPIAQEGILGADFLRDASNINLSKKYVEWQGTKIPFTTKETVVVPARSQTTFYVRVNNPHIKIGYVPRLRVCEDIHLGDAVVTNRDGKAYLRVINTGEIDRELIVPTIELQECAISINGPPASGERSRSINTLQTQSKRERDSQIQKLLRLEHLNKEESEHTIKLISKHSDLFQLPDEELSQTNVIEHRIITADEQPINTKQYRFPPIHKEEINNQVKNMLQNNIIKESKSPYNSPLWIVPKKADSKGNKRWRLVIDFRALNEKTLGDAYPLPNITDILDQLGSAKYFSVFDLASGFHQIPMHEADAQKTAFSTPFGHYEYKRMPFGLKNAPATFQRLMDRILSGLQGTELFVYLDDIVIYASSLTEHETKFNRLAERLRNANLRLQPDKCEFLRKEVTYLGHIISETGVKPDPGKVEAVRNFPRPKNDKNIKQFLGLAGYYRRFICNFSKIAKPLTALLKKGEPFKWLESQETAFKELKEQLCTEPLLQHPDFTKPFILTTDASGYAVGGILSQGTIGKDRPIAYASRLLNRAEGNYSTIEKELLAIVYCVNHFRPYLYGNKFSLVTDHKPLVWLHSVKDPTSRLIRWRLKLAEYEYQVIYKAGKTNCNADALSRNPVPTSSSIDPFEERQCKLPTKICDPRDDDEVTLETEDVINEPFPRDKQLLPFHVSNPDSDDETLFDVRPALEITNGVTQTRTNKNRQEMPSPSGKEKEISNTIPDTCTEYESDSTDTDPSDSETDEDENIFDQPNEPYDLNPHDRIKFDTSRQSILTRNDNLVVFVTQSGEPCEKGSHSLKEANLLPPIRNAALARARVTAYRKKHLIALVIKEKISALTEREIIEESVHSLADVIKELGIETFSICNGNIDGVSWKAIRKLLESGLRDTKVKITICENALITPAEDQREGIINENHASAVAGHKGVSKTLRRIKDKYYWPRMRTDVETFIQRCRNCQLKKLVRRKTKQPMVLTDTPDAAFDKISMDIMGPLPVSHSENAYILTIQDLLTKYSVAIPLKQAGAIDVADALTNDFICIYGAPKALLTDQGSHFLNALMKAVARKFRISHFKTTAYRPQSNGSIERSHHVLWEYLKQTIKDKRDWDTYLKLACFSYNTSVHEGTQYTPHELVFGKLARVPSREPLPEDIVNESYAEYLTELYNRLRNVQENANHNLKAAKERSKRYYDKRINPRKFKVGDLVLLLKEPTKKLEDQYVGPYEIIEILDNNNVKIRINAKTIKIVHSDKLKKIPTQEDQAQTPTRQQSEDTAASTSHSSKR